VLSIRTKIDDLELL